MKLPKGDTPMDDIAKVGRREGKGAKVSDGSKKGTVSGPAKDGGDNVYYGSPTKSARSGVKGAKGEGTPVIARTNKKKPVRAKK